jgi:hypothetical protein
VILALASMSLAGLIYGAPSWAVVVIFLGGLVLHMVRANARERHQVHLAQIAVENASIEVEMVKARHRDLLLYDQPELPIAEKRIAAPRRQRRDKQ